MDVEQKRKILHLMHQGVLTHLSVKWWRGPVSISDVDLGYAFDSAEQKSRFDKYTYNKGFKLATLNEFTELRKINNKARKSLYAHSFDTKWGRFIPFTAFESWQKETDSLRAQFNKQALFVGNNYDAILSSIKSEYSELAKDVWKRLYPECEGEANISFVESFSNGIISKTPALPDLMESFSFEPKFSIIPNLYFGAKTIIKESDFSETQQFKKVITDLCIDGMDHDLEHFWNLVMTDVQLEIKRRTNHLLNKYENNTFDFRSIKSVDSLVTYASNMNLSQNEGLKKLISELIVAKKNFRGVAKGSDLIKCLQAINEFTF